MRPDAWHKARACLLMSQLRQLHKRRRLNVHAGGFNWSTLLPSRITCRLHLLCPVCSYVSGGFYARNDGKNWIHTMIITANLFPLACFGIALVLNTIAIFYQAR